MIALKSYRYGGRQIAMGESFQAQSAHDAHILTVTGLALHESGIEDVVPSRVPIAVAKQHRKYRRRKGSLS